MSFFGALKHGFSNFYRPTRKDIPQLIETVFIHIEMCIDFSFSRILVLCRNFERTFHHLSNPEFCGVSRMFLGGGGGLTKLFNTPCFQVLNTGCETIFKSKLTTEILLKCLVYSIVHCFM